jgi:hypothetical protein
VGEEDAGDGGEDLDRDPGKGFAGGEVPVAGGQDADEGVEVCARDRSQKGDQDG